MKTYRVYFTWSNGRTGSADVLAKTEEKARASVIRLNLGPTVAVASIDRVEEI